MTRVVLLAWEYCIYRYISIFIYIDKQLKILIIYGTETTRCMCTVFFLKVNKVTALALGRPCIHWAPRGRRALRTIFLQKMISKLPLSPIIAVVPEEAKLSRASTVGKSKSECVNTYYGKQTNINYLRK